MRYIVFSCALLSGCIDGSINHIATDAATGGGIDAPDVGLYDGDHTLLRPDMRGGAGGVTAGTGGLQDAGSLQDAGNPSTGGVDIAQPPALSAVCVPCREDADCEDGLVCDQRDLGGGPARCLPSCTAVRAADDEPACDGAFGSGEELGTATDGHGHFRPPWICGDSRYRRKVCEPIVDDECINETWLILGGFREDTCTRIDLCEAWIDSNN